MICNYLLCHLLEIVDVVVVPVHVGDDHQLAKTCQHQQCNVRSKQRILHNVACKV